MFNNILTEENISFKEIEKICFKIACEFAKEILKTMLEEYDKKLMNGRDTTLYRNKGLKSTTVKTLIGEVEYKRRMYINKEENKCVYLLDETLNTKGVGNVSEHIVDIIINNIKDLSYRACARTINEATGISISGVAIWNIIQNLGLEIEKMEDLELYYAGREDSERVYFDDYYVKMDIENIDELFELQDKKYAEFQAKLTPGIPQENFIGVRVPEVRKLAKQYIKEPESKQFIQTLPHQYYDENMLHGLLLSELKDYDECISEVDKFLPYVDNLAVCDIMSPKIFKKNKEKLIEKIKIWAKSKETYTCRFGIEMLMSHFLDDDFKPEYLEIPANVHSDEYYVQMMIAWFFATALAKKWDDTIPYIENNKLDKWVHNKTIQKARESYRITDEQKEYLKTKKI